MQYSKPVRAESSVEKPLISQAPSGAAYSGKLADDAAPTGLKFYNDAAPLALKTKPPPRFPAAAEMGRKRIIVSAGRTDFPWAVNW
jgi:hypothetical protein